MNVRIEEHRKQKNKKVEKEEDEKLRRESGKKIEDGKDKIIKKLCDNVYIEKVDDEAL